MVLRKFMILCAAYLVDGHGEIAIEILHTSQLGGHSIIRSEPSVITLLMNINILETKPD